MIVKNNCLLAYFAIDSNENLAPGLRHERDNATTGIQVGEK